MAEGEKTLAPAPSDEERICAKGHKRAYYMDLDTECSKCKDEERYQFQKATDETRTVLIARDVETRVEGNRINEIGRQDYRNHIEEWSRLTREQTAAFVRIAVALEALVKSNG